MSRIIIKSSTTAGTIPSALGVGELAINTTDGKLYYSSGSIVKLLVASGSGGGGGGTGTVTSVGFTAGTNISLSGTNPITTTGTITIGTVGLLTTSSFNSWTGSSTSQFAGTASYAATASYALNAGGAAATGSNATASFTNQSTWTFTHNLNNRFVVVETFDASYNQIIPQTLTLTDTNTATITFPTLESGYAIASIGGANIITYQINNTASALFATTGSNTFNGNQTVNGWVSASLGFTGSLLGTASYLSQTVIDSILADALAFAVAL